MLILSTQNEKLDKILSEINFIKDSKEIQYHVHQYKNDIHSIANKDASYFTSKDINVRFEGNFSIDIPIVSFNLLFESFKLKTYHNHFNEVFYLSNTFVLKGKSYRILMCESQELMGLVQKYINDRVYKIIGSFCNVSIESPLEILKKLVESSII